MEWNVSLGERHGCIHDVSLPVTVRVETLHAHARSNLFGASSSRRNKFCRIARIVNRLSRRARKVPRKSPARVLFEPLILRR